MAPPTLLLLEHEPVITLGRQLDQNDVLVPPDKLAALGIGLQRTERGGRATYHGPGQLVGYPIGRLHDLAPDVPTYVWRIEEALIRTGRRLGVPGTRQPEQHGVWVGNTKLAFIGIAISRGICWHGFALNVDLDLGPFDLIRPCGLEVEATSIAQCTGSAPSTEEVGWIFEEEFRAVFRFEARRV